MLLTLQIKNVLPVLVRILSSTKLMINVSDVQHVLEFVLYHVYLEKLKKSILLIKKNVLNVEHVTQLVNLMLSKEDKKVKGVERLNGNGKTYYRWYPNRSA